MSRNPPICTLGLRNLIAAFNTRVRRDPVLAPVLAQQVGTSDADWAAHVAAEEHFWSSVILAGDRRRPRPLPSRPCLLNLEPAAFERWLSLLGGTCADLFEPPVAATLQIYIAHAPLLPAKAARRGIAITASRCAILHFD